LRFSLLLDLMLLDLLKDRVDDCQGPRESSILGPLEFVPDRSVGTARSQFQLRLEHQLDQPSSSYYCSYYSHYLTTMTTAQRWWHRERPNVREDRPMQGPPVIDLAVHLVCIEQFEQFE
jgi:hypothetical protein